jgi:hypothetical protein
MPLYLPFLKRTRKNSSFGSNFVFVTGINSLTHPIVFFFIMNLKLTYLQNILIAESFAILAEAGILWWILSEKFWKCLTISALANFSSWQLSPMVTYTYH